jgi:signal transduction histidine kinase
VNNSIRYNKENGSIFLTGHYEPGQPYVLEIKDTGIGIRPEELGSVFNRFKSGRDKTEGYGLGLSIVKSIISFLGFEIKVTSAYGEWTVFSIIIPSEMIEVIQPFKN